LNAFYKCICEKNAALLAQVEKTEPLLAAELKEEMQKTVVEEDRASPPRTPPRARVFASPLLTQIAGTPRAQLCSPTPVQRRVNTPPHTEAID
jgi:hypothetical protein